MGRQIEGQMSMLDIIKDKTGYTIGDQYRAEGYISAYDAKPDHECEVDVIDHNGNKFRAIAKLSFGRMAFDTNKYGSRGYDICWWREVKHRTCAGCAHFRDVVSGLGDIYHDTACLKDRPWAKFKKPEDPACKDYKPKEDAQNDN